MKRIAYTIIYNGLHHLKHELYAERLCNALDHWIIIEGAAGNGGSTSWCNMLDRSYASKDGTREFIEDLSKKYPGKVSYRFAQKFWAGKDDMVRAAVDALILAGHKECFLWEIDADEQWLPEQMERAEERLLRENAKTGTFLCDYYLSHDLLAVGQWGEGNLIPYRRLWHWRGEQFAKHEPPELEGGNGKTILIEERFKHFAFLFERDVYFKSQYYGGHEMIYHPWLKLQLEAERSKLEFPLHISFLFGKKGWIGESKTYIKKIEA